MSEDGLCQDELCQIYKNRDNGSPSFKAIKKALTGFIRGWRDLDLGDLVLIKKIEDELISQGLLRPEGCICRAREDELE